METRTIETTYKSHEIGDRFDARTSKAIDRHCLRNVGSIQPTARLRVQTGRMTAGNVMGGGIAGAGPVRVCDMGRYWKTKWNQLEDVSMRRNPDGLWIIEGATWTDLYEVIFGPVDIPDMILDLETGVARREIMNALQTIAGSPDPDTAARESARIADAKRYLAVDLGFGRGDGLTSLLRFD